SIKIGGIAARPDAAEVVTVFGKTAVFCGGSAPGQGGGSVRVVHVGPTGESKLVLAHSAEGMYDALSQLDEVRFAVGSNCFGRIAALKAAAQGGGFFVSDSQPELTGVGLPLRAVGGSTYRNMILDNLELVVLLINEHCDGGIILETDGHKLASSVLLTDEQEATRAEEQAQSKGGKGGLHRVFLWNGWGHDHCTSIEAGERASSVQFE
ncbi:hypothetical protein HJC23_012829, partial [Cyclotella cryptica]